MEKLNNNDFKCDKEPTVGEELKIDDKFIEEQLESYKKTLESPIIQEVEDPNIVRKLVFPNGENKEN